MRSRASEARAAPSSPFLSRWTLSSRCMPASSESCCCACASCVDRPPKMCDSLRPSAPRLSRSALLELSPRPTLAAASGPTVLSTCPSRRCVRSLPPRAALLADPLLLPRRRSRTSARHRSTRPRLSSASRHGAAPCRTRTRSRSPGWTGARRSCHCRSGRPSGSRCVATPLHSSPSPRRVKLMSAHSQQQQKGGLETAAAAFDMRESWEQPCSPTSSDAVRPYPPPLSISYPTADEDVDRSCAHGGSSRRIGGCGRASSKPRRALASRLTRSCVALPPSRRAATSQCAVS